MTWWHGDMVSWKAKSCQGFPTMANIAKSCQRWPKSGQKMNSEVAKSSWMWPKVYKNGQKLTKKIPKFSQRCLKLPKAAKSSQQMPKVAKI